MDKQKVAPSITETDEDTLFNLDTVASATECTGLMPTPPISEDEVESYTDLYSIPQPDEPVDNGFQHIEKSKSRTNE